ncbi:MAG: hypothetical protein R2828_30660 [Saprospiraceae bacterium]
MNIKTISLGLFGFLMAAIPQLLSAQIMTKTIPLNGAKRVEIYMERASLDISGHDANNIVIETEGNKPPPDRAKGLRPLFNNAVDNTGIGIMVEESADKIVIKKASSHQLEVSIKLPQNLALKVEEISWMGGGDYKFHAYKGEIEVKSNSAAIQLEQVSGPIVASSTSGSIDVIFAKLDQTKPSAISNISGPIDITIAADEKATFKLETITGETYTDLNLDFGQPKDGMQSIGHRKNKGHLNGGGVELALHSISSTIYIRKKK